MEIDTQGHWETLTSGSTMSWNTNKGGKTYSTVDIYRAFSDRYALLIMRVNAAYRHSQDETHFTPTAMLATTGECALP